MKFKIIACINNNNVLGKDNSLIYNIKNDYIPNLKGYITIILKL